MDQTAQASHPTVHLSTREPIYKWIRLDGRARWNASLKLGLLGE